MPIPDISIMTNTTSVSTMLAHYIRSDKTKEAASIIMGEMKVLRIPVHNTETNRIVQYKVVDEAENSEDESDSSESDSSSSSSSSSSDESREKKPKKIGKEKGTNNAPLIRRNNGTFVTIGQPSKPTTAANLPREDSKRQ